MGGTTFETFAPYFHRRWELNLAMPTKSIVGIALNILELEKLLMAETTHQRDLVDEGAAPNAQGGGACADDDSGDQRGGGGDDDGDGEFNDQFVVDQSFVFTDKALPPARRRQQQLALGMQLADI